MLGRVPMDPSGVGISQMVYATVYMPKFKANRNRFPASCVDVHATAQAAIDAAQGDVKRFPSGIRPFQIIGRAVFVLLGGVAVVALVSLFWGVGSFRLRVLANFAHYAILEEYCHTVTLNRATGSFQVEHIVPTIFVEIIDQQRRAEDCLHLLRTHAWTHHRQLFSSDFIALLDFHFV